MEKVIHSLIKEDQTGFIKGRNASDNMRRLLHILDFDNKKNNVPQRQIANLIIYSA